MTQLMRRLAPRLLALCCLSLPPPGLQADEAGGAGGNGGGGSILSAPVIPPAQLEAFTAALTPQQRQLLEDYADACSAASGHQMQWQELVPWIANRPQTEILDYFADLPDQTDERRRAADRFYISPREQAAARGLRAGAGDDVRTACCGSLADFRDAGARLRADGTACRALLLAFARTQPDASFQQLRALTLLGQLQVLTEDELALDAALEGAAQLRRCQLEDPRSSCAVLLDRKATDWLTNRDFPLATWAYYSFATRGHGRDGLAVLYGQGRRSLVVDNCSDEHRMVLDLGDASRPAPPSWDAAVAMAGAPGTTAPVRLEPHHRYAVAGASRQQEGPTYVTFVAAAVSDRWVVISWQPPEPAPR